MEVGHLLKLSTPPQFLQRPLRMSLALMLISKLHIGHIQPEKQELVLGRLEIGQGSVSYREGFFFDCQIFHFECTKYTFECSKFDICITLFNEVTLTSQGYVFDLAGMVLHVIKHIGNSCRLRIYSLYVNCSLNLVSYIYDIFSISI